MKNMFFTQFYKTDADNILNKLFRKSCISPLLIPPLNTNKKVN